MAKLEAVVKGRVQGVGYRAFVKRQADLLGLAGWVENLHDGAVALEATGPADALEHFLAHLSRGPMFARVEAVDTRWHDNGTDPAGLPAGFRVRR